MNWNEQYRPKDFTEMTGNREQMEQIEGFILHGNIPHLLFYGDSGTGKTTLAQVIADKVCGEHSGNFIEINASDERGIETIRKVVISAIKHQSIAGGTKVIFLDEADGLTQDAQQILRRPMEKSGTCLFIIACNDINKVSKAIQSRCAVFTFRPLTEKDIVVRLNQICMAEGLSLNAETLTEVAVKAKGDMRTAIHELQKVAAMAHRSSEIDRLVDQYLNDGAKGRV